MTITNEEKPSEKVDLDNILIKIGQFGRFQLIQYILIAFILIFTAFSSLSFLFTAGNLEYRCYIPECENISNTEYYPEWLKVGVPIKNSVPDSCTHYMVKQNKSEEQCTADNFDKDVKMTCDEFIYKNDENTILTEFGLHCRKNEWKLTLPGTINNFGQLLCFPMTGLLSDRFGRKAILLWATLISGVLGLIRSFSVNYEMFLTFEFLDPLIGSGAFTTAFILGLELVGPDKRAMGGTIACGFYAIGEAMLGLIAMYVRDWRWLLRALYIPFFICIAYFWWIPESVRWLISKGRMHEAKEILIMTAKVNRKPLSPETLDQFEKDNPTHQDWKSEKVDLMYVIRTPHLRWRVINCSFCWLTNVFVFYGLSLNSVSLAGSKYLNFIAVSLVEIPALFLANDIMDRIGRRWSLSGSMLISAVACIASGLVPESIAWLTTTIFLIGKMSISVSFTVIYVYTAEMFPTNIRHSLLAICSAFGRVGSMASPQTPLLSNIWLPLPYIMFGVLSAVSGILAFLFPETAHTHLPETFEDLHDSSKAQNRHSFISNSNVMKT